jgi:hypothetical protein
VPWPIGFVVIKGIECTCLHVSGIPTPVSLIVIADMLARLEIAIDACDTSRLCCRCNGQCSAVGHGVARVDRQIEKCIFHLIGDHTAPARDPFPDDLHLHFFADRPRNNSSIVPIN